MFVGGGGTVKVNGRKETTSKECFPLCILHQVARELNVGRKDSFICRDAVITDNYNGRLWKRSPSAPPFPPLGQTTE